MPAHWVLAIMTGSATLTAPAQGEIAALAPPDGWQLVWQDNFETGDVPDEQRWHYDTQRNRAGWYNGEQQYYARRRPSNARITGGRLIIEAHHEDFARMPRSSRPTDWGGQVYSSSRLTTRGHASWHTGFFEIRANLPCGRGLWPAIWLLPDSHRGAWRGGEIDIAEMVGHMPDTVFHSLHTQEANFRTGDHVQETSKVAACGSMHDYQLLWTADSLTIGVDSRPALTAPATDLDRPMSLIVNLAVGGSWAGVEGIADDAFPARMEIEHVRIWQAPR